MVSQPLWAGTWRNRQTLLFCIRRKSSSGTVVISIEEMRSRSSPGRSVMASKRSIRRRSSSAQVPILTPVRTISRWPAAMSCRASPMRSAKSRLRLRPRAKGISQKAQKKSQPSWILRLARVWLRSMAGAGMVKRPRPGGGVISRGSPSLWLRMISGSSILTALPATQQTPGRRQRDSPCICDWQPMRAIRARAWARWIRWTSRRVSWSPFSVTVQVLITTTSAGSLKSTIS